VQKALEFIHMKRFAILIVHYGYSKLIWGKKHLGVLVT